MSNRTTHRKLRLHEMVGGYLEKILIRQKLNNWLGIALFAVIAIFFGYMMVNKLILGIGVVVGLVGTGVVLVCLFNSEAGFYITMVYCFLAFYLDRFLFYYGVDFPVGVLSDALILATLLSLLIKKANLKQTVNEFGSTTVVRLMLITYAYFAIQLFNPNAGSLNGWWNTFRKILGTLFLFYSVYNIINSYADAKKFLKVLFIFCAASGIYGCIQEWHGLFDFEMFWLMSDPHGFALAFIGGIFRKFGNMSDPAAYGIAMSAMSVLYLVLVTGSMKRNQKIVLWAGIIFMILAMGYSGTRTANAMLVAGLCLFILFTFNEKKTRQFAIAGGLLFCVVLYGPYNNPTISRFRTTFSASQDASYQVRELNRRRMQDYMITHPIGGGMSMTGATGKTFAPGHPLAGFQPDSDYVKKALEIGPIGLILFLLQYFFVLQAGIRGYFSSTHKEVKLIYAAITCAMFAFYVGEYAQKALGQITDMVIYYPLIVILLKLKNFSDTPIIPKPLLN